MVDVRRWLILLITLLVFPAACVPAESAEAAIPEPLLGSRWLLETLAARPLAPDTTITLIFDIVPGGDARGSAGCNSYGANIAAGSSEQLRFGEITLTAMACVDESGNIDNDVMDQESVYVKALNAVRYYQVEEDALTLLDENRQPLLTYTRQEVFQNDPAALIGTAWRLTSWDGDPVDPQPPYTIRFEAGRASGTAGCRTYQTEVQVGPQEINFVSLAMDQPACDGDPALAEREGDFTTLMDSAWSYRLLPDRLEVVTARGEALSFVPLEEEDPVVDATVWKLTAFVENGEESPVLEGSEITLSFEGNVVAAEGRLAGSAGCNRYSAHYRTEGDGLVMQPPVSTKMFCAEPAGVMDQEMRFLTVLMDVNGYAMDAGRLTLTTPDGRALVFASN